MASYINTNVGSLFAAASLSKSQSQMQVSLQRLSSGLRINSAKDDATGLVTATNYDSSLRGTYQAIRNAQDGISTAQTNDGYLAQLTENLQRMRELAVQGGGSIASGASAEASALVLENTRILGLVTTSGNVVVQSDGTSVAATGAAPSVSATSTASVSTIDTDLSAVNTARASYGADMATFESAINNLQTASVNIAAAKSRVLDTDYAFETAQLTRNQILQQAGTAMLAQANQLPNSVLTLLR